MIWRSRKKQDTLSGVSKADSPKSFTQEGNAFFGRFQPSRKEQQRSKKEQTLLDQQMWKIIRKLAGEDPLQQAFAENEVRQVIRGDGDWTSISNVSRRLAASDVVKDLLGNITLPVVGIGWLFVAAAAIIRFLFENFSQIVAWGIIILMGCGVYFAYRKYRATINWQAIGLGRAMKVVDNPDGAFLLLLVRSARELPGETSVITANLLDRMHHPLDVWMQYPEALLGLRAAVSRTKGLLETPETANQREVLQLAAIRKVGAIRDVDSIPLLKVLTQKKAGNHHDLAVYEESRRSLEILEHFKANPHAWYEE